MQLMMTVSYRTTEAVLLPIQVSTAVTTVIPPPSVDSYQLILEKRLLDIETENRNLREAASHLFTSNQPLSQEITMAKIPISIAYPADKVTAFAQTFKQDSQLQSFASSSTPSTMYPIAVDVDSVPPPLASVVPSTTNQDSSSSSSTRSSTSTSTRRIQPIPLQDTHRNSQGALKTKLSFFFLFFK